MKSSPVLLFLALLSGVGTGLGLPPEQDVSAQQPVLEPQLVGQPPFAPTNVLLDGSSLYVFSFSGQKLARLDRMAKRPEFTEIAGAELSSGSSVAARNGLIYVSRRAAQEVIILEESGKVKSRFSTWGPPSFLAVDDLGAAYVFSFFPRSEDKDALLAVYDSYGNHVRSVGSFPGQDPTAPLLQKRSAGMPLLRTDASGSVWALLGDGKTAIRVGLSKNSQDIYELETTENGEKGAAPAKEAAAHTKAKDPEERDPEAEKEKQLREKLVSESKRLGLDTNDPSFRAVIIKQPKRRFSDFACAQKECVALQSDSLRSDGKSTSARFLLFDTDKKVENREVLLGGSPGSLVGVAFQKKQFYLFAMKGSELLQYELDF